MELRMKKTLISWGLTEKSDFQGRVSRKTKKTNNIQQGGGDTPGYTMVLTSELSGWLVEFLKGLPSLVHTTNQF